MRCKALSLLGDGRYRRNLHGQDEQDGYLFKGAAPIRAEDRAKEIMAGAAGFEPAHGGTKISHEARISAAFAAERPTYPQANINNLPALCGTRSHQIHPSILEASSFFPAKKGRQVSHQLALFDRSVIVGELQFAEFYRESLRPMIGRRTKASDLREAYLAWAVARGRGSLSAKDIARFMSRHGHHRIRSNGVRYLDIELKAGGGAPGGDPLMEEAAAMVLTAISQQSERERLLRARLQDMAGQVDGLIDQLHRLRSTISAELDA